MMLSLTVLALGSMPDVLSLLLSVVMLLDPHYFGLQLVSLFSVMCIIDNSRIINFFLI